MNETLRQRCENHGTPENSEQPGLLGAEQEEMKLQSAVKDSLLFFFFKGSFNGKVLDLIPRKWLGDFKGIILIILFLSLRNWTG